MVTVSCQNFTHRRLTMIIAIMTTCKIKIKVRYKKTTAANNHDNMQKSIT